MRREALAEAAAAKEKAEFERVMAEKENLRKQQEAEEEKRRQHERDMAILAADKAEAVARARLKAIEESLIEEENEEELIRGADTRCKDSRTRLWVHSQESHHVDTPLNDCPRPNDIPPPITDPLTPEVKFASFPK